MMTHVEECFQYPPCVCEENRPHYDNCTTRKKCICEQLLSAGARGYKSGYDDAYFDGYNDGYDSALSHRACFNQHGKGENP
jgi:hypothetical protein